MSVAKGWMSCTARTIRVAEVQRLLRALARAQTYICSLALVLLVLAPASQAQSSIMEGLLRSIPDSATIIFGPAEGHRVVVFTDPSCPHCRKFHANVQNWSDSGLRVAYLPLPRSGLRSTNAEKIFAHWCNQPHSGMQESLNVALTEGKTESGRGYCSKKWGDYYRSVIRTFNPPGTPTIILPDGVVVPGDASPQMVREYLDSKES